MKPSRSGAATKYTPGSSARPTAAACARPRPSARAAVLAQLGGIELGDREALHAIAGAARFSGVAKDDEDPVAVVGQAAQVAFGGRDVARRPPAAGRRGTARAARAARDRPRPRRTADGGSRAAAGRSVRAARREGRRRARRRSRRASARRRRARRSPGARRAPRRRRPGRRSGRTSGPGRAPRPAGRPRQASRRGRRAPTRRAPATPRPARPRPSGRPRRPS